MRRPDVGDLYLTRTKLDIPYSAGQHILHIRRSRPGPIVTRNHHGRPVAAGVSPIQVSANGPYRPIPRGSPLACVIATQPVDSLNP